MPHPKSVIRGILFQKLFWPICTKKNCFWYRETLFQFRDRRTRNLQNFWYHYNNTFKQWKVRTIFEIEYFSNLLFEVSQIYFTKNAQKQVRKLHLTFFNTKLTTILLWFFSFFTEKFAVKNNQRSNRIMIVWFCNLKNPKTWTTLRCLPDKFGFQVAHSLYMELLL